MAVINKTYYMLSYSLRQYKARYNLDMITYVFCEADFGHDVFHLFEHLLASHFIGFPVKHPFLVVVRLENP